MIIAPRTKQGIEPGQFYRVPTAFGYLNYWPGNWPVLGPRHEDSDYLNFPHYHFHFDWRFIPPRVYDEVMDHILNRYGSEGAVYALVLHDVEGAKPGVITYRRRKCYRTFPDYYKRTPWLPELTKAYNNHTLDDSLICPHRGASLATIPPDKDGCVTCPLPGLKWNLKTRRVVT